MARGYRVHPRSRDVRVRLCQLPMATPQADVERVLAESVDADLVVISELKRSTADSLIEGVRAQAVQHRQYLVLGRGAGTYAGRVANEVGIYAPDGAMLHQAKLSLSQWDREQTPPVEAGDELLVHTSGQLRFVVLNCHDYTHASLVHDLVELEVDLVIVPAANQAAQMFMEYARADAHRLFAYVVLCNVADVGGSGVYAPFMSRHTEAGIEGTPGELSMGGVQFEARGSAQSVVEVKLAIPELRAMRERYRRIDPDDPKAIRALPTEYKAIAPPEIVTYSRPPYRTVVARVRGGEADIVDVALEDTRPAERRGSATWRIALAQLRSAGLEAYLSTRYVPSKSPAGQGVADEVARLLQAAVSGAAGSSLVGADLVVFPEVHLPVHAQCGGQSLDAHLRDYSNTCRAIVVGGIEYEPTGTGPGTNRVRIYAPGREPIDFLKLTRSQYDARSAASGGTSKVGAPFAMTRGDRLLRFTVGDSLSFGVLTCFDFSHLELVHLLNTWGRPSRRAEGAAASADESTPATGPTPLDLMIVPCFNPFGALYADLARADAHRYFQYVAVCNVAEHGESGVFGPEHTPHPRRTLIQAGKNVETILRVDLAIDELRRVRDTMTDDEIAKERRAERDDRSHRRTFHRKPGLLTDGERFVEAARGRR